MVRKRDVNHWHQADAVLIAPEVIENFLHDELYGEEWDPQTLENVLEAIYDRGDTFFDTDTAIAGPTEFGSTDHEHGHVDHGNGGMSETSFYPWVSSPPKEDLVEQFLARAETSGRHARRAKDAIVDASRQGHGPLVDELVADPGGLQEVPTMYVGPAPPRPVRKPRSERRRLQHK